MGSRSWMTGVALMGLCTAGSAFAAVDASRVAGDLHYNEDRTPVGLDVRLGVGGLTGEAGSLTKAGPLVGITAGAQPFRLIGIEGGIEGQRLPISDPRVPQGEALWRYNLGLLVKAGPLIVQDKVRPYVGAGAGISYFNASSGAEGLYRNDFVGELPIAAGVDYRFTPGIYAGARATYRFMVGEDFADAATLDAKTSGGLLNFSIAAGGRF